MHNVRMLFDRSRAGWKDQIAIRASEFPFLQGVGDNRQKRDSAFSGCGLRTAYGVEPIGPLPDVQFAPVKINIGPAQAAQFAGAQSPSLISPPLSPAERRLPINERRAPRAERP